MAGVAAAVLAILGGVAQAQVAPSGTIRLGFTAALTGPFGEFGEGIRRGAEIAVEAWNRAGGVNGRKVELAEVLDDQLMPDRAVDNMRRILANKEVAAVMAPSGSGPALAVVDMVVADGRPMCNPQAQNPAVVYPDGPDKPPRPNVFSVSISLAVEAEKLGKLLGGRYKSIGIMHESTAYGVTGADLVRRQIAATNREPKIAVEPYNQRAQDMGAQVTRLQRAGVDAVLVIGLGADGAVIRKTMSRLGFEVPFYGSAGLITAPYMEGTGELAAGTRALTAVTFGLRPLPPTVQTFLDAYRAKYGSDRWYGPDPANPLVSMSTSVGSGYDCVNVLLDAIKRANSTQPEAVIKALEQTRDLPGVSVGRISFSRQDHLALKPDDLGSYEMVNRDGTVALQLVGE